MKRSLSYLRTVWRNRRRHGSSPPDDPRFLTYIVTFTCNARCVMCDSWQKPSPDDLSLDEISNIFSQMPRMDGVRLSGGEPFVRRDLLDIAHLVQEKLQPLFLHVTTNGFLTDRIVRFCEERRKDVPLRLLVSADGVENKHNQVRGHKKAWDYVVRTLQALAPRRQELRLELGVNQTVVDAEGVDHYRKLRDFLKPIGVHNHMVMAYDASATYNLEEETDVAPTEIGQFFTFGEFSRDQLSELFDEVERDLSSYPPLERLAKRYYLKGIRNRLLHEHGNPNPGCVAMTNHIRLLPNGDMPTCQFNTRTAGNLRQQNFSEVWHGETAAKQRSWVRDCPGCWAECEVLPNAIYTGDLLRQSLWPRGGTGQRKQVPPEAPDSPGVKRALPVVQ